LNEAPNLISCLDALGWCDDIVMVDSGSIDGTLDIARKRNIRVLHHSFRDFASQRNFGLAEGKFRHNWVLHLDADEIVTPEFVRRLAELEAHEGIDAYCIPSKLVMCGRWLRHAGMYPVYQVRLGRVGALRFRQVGHGQHEDLPSERIAIFDEPYVHHAFSQGFKRWLEKHIEYAEAEAEELIRVRSSVEFHFNDLFAGNRTVRRRVVKAFSYRIPLFCRPLLRFWYVYVFRCGFLDGRPGFVYSVMLSVYETMIAILAYGRNNATAAGVQESQPELFNNRRLK
jgi:glycosyltransferase involved in cell wall biosynthesis